MNRTLTLFILLLLGIFHISAQQETESYKIITLVHNTKETYFSSDEVAKSIAAAVDGDTLYFSPGVFSGDFIVDKALTFIGTGALDPNTKTDDYWGYGTEFTGNIDVNTTQDSQLPSITFEGIKFDRQVSFSCPLKNLVLRKCWVSQYFHHNNDIENYLIDRCRINLHNTGTMSTHDIKLIAKNCYITNFYTGAKDWAYWKFYNCTIDPSYDLERQFCSTTAAYTNCIIHNRGCYLEFPAQETGPILTNTLYDNYETGIDVTKNCTIESCYTNSSEDIDITQLTPEELRQNNYLGTDGDIIGCYGGQTPYTLQYNTPEISSKKVHFNKESKQIEVSISFNSK